MCDDRYPLCDCKTWQEHLAKNPAIRQLGEQILEQQKRRQDAAGWRTSG